MKKKILLMLLLGGMTLMPTGMMAKSDYGWDDNAEPVIWRTPAHNPYVYITYDESNGTVLVTFNSAVDNAEILVNLNGEEVDYQVIDATTGMQIPISLPIYGSGEFTIQVKSGTTLLSIENI
jgi:hypothetical protein